MGQTGLKVSTERMAEIAVRASRYVEDYADRISALGNKVTSLMQIWSSPSAKEFNAATDIHIKKNQEFKEVLGLMAEKLKQGSGTFSDTEEDNAAAARKLQETNYNYINGNNG